MNLDGIDMAERIDGQIPVEILLRSQAANLIFRPISIDWGRACIPWVLWCYQVARNIENHFFSKKVQSQEVLSLLQADYIEIWMQRARI